MRTVLRSVKLTSYRKTRSSTGPRSLVYIFDLTTRIIRASSLSRAESKKISIHYINGSSLLYICDVIRPASRWSQHRRLRSRIDKGADVRTAVFRAHIPNNGARSWNSRPSLKRPDRPYLTVFSRCYN